MDIQNKVEGNEGKFIIEEHNEVVARMDYQLKDKNILLIIHTEVDDTLSGHGVGKELLSAAVDYARQKSFMVKATCTFAKAILDKSPEYKDIYTP